MKRLGTAGMIAGGVVTLLSMFLHFAAGVSWWQATTRYPAIVSALTVAAMVLAAVSVAVDRWLIPSLAGAIAAFLLGESFSLYGSYHFAIGFWVQVFGTVTMTVSGLLLIGGLVTRLATDAAIATQFARERGMAPAAGGSAPASGVSAATPASRSPTPTAATPYGQATKPTPVTALPPAGWYPDPSGSADERYWSGQAWTHEVRGAGHVHQPA